MDQVIAIEDPRSEDVRQLLALHLAFSRAVTPAGFDYVLEPEALAEHDLTLFGLRRDGVLVGIGALHRLEEFHAELKSMHTAEAVRGQGVGRAMVEHLLGFARARRGYRRVSLETGTMPEFAPARALYAAIGFQPCAAFGVYSPSPYNTFMSIEIAKPSP